MKNNGNAYHSLAINPYNQEWHCFVLHLKENSSYGHYNKDYKQCKYTDNSLAL